MSGADTIAITSSIKFAVVKKMNVPTDIDEICEKYFIDNDIILVDGFTLSDKPRIIVVEKKEDAVIFERGCRVISVTDGNIDDIGIISGNVIDFFNEP
jgi:molybdopterin-guanine dinucleotide biosynthesis protein